ncbi:MAG: hypothetical protein ACOC8L_05705, partial [Spirochaetota bacterium]
MRTSRILAILSFASFAAVLPAQALRGPLAARLEVQPGTSKTATLGMEEIVLVELAGDTRFFDAIEIRLETPAAVSSVSGAVSLSILGPARVSGEGPVTDIVGEELLLSPLQRGGTTFYQIKLREDAEPSASAAVRRIEKVVPASQFPIALSIVTR